MVDNPAACSQSPLDNRKKNVRGRSLSVPCRGEASDVDTVMVKARRASAYLWTLLHSQNCRLGVDRCTHSGCADAKLVHLHMKTCPAGHDFPCPTRYAGCLQARKLLAHHRQCRNIRARQVGLSPSIKGQHACLICSMVARQARSLLDNNIQSSKAASQVIAHKKSSSNSKCHMVSSFTLKAKLNTGGTLSSSSSLKTDVRDDRRKILSSFTLSADSTSAQFFSEKSPPTGDWGMPPPAPRPRSAPASPMGSAREELKQGTSDTVSMSIPLFRKRSESLVGNIDPTGGRRAVSFAARPQFLASSPPKASLVAVELAPEADESSGSKVGRGRSASCHLLRSSDSNSPDVCGTTYEEIGGE